MQLHDHEKFEGELRQFAPKYFFDFDGEIQRFAPNDFEKIGQK